MKFIADLHIHSHFSRATSRSLDPEHIAIWARKKGITVIGTGDLTHPGWVSELQEKLIEAENGLYRLKPDLEKRVKDFFYYIFINACTCISNYQTRVGSWFHIRDWQILIAKFDFFKAHFYFSACSLYNMKGFGAQVHYNLMNLCGVSFYYSGVIADILFNLNKGRLTKLMGCFI